MTTFVYTIAIENCNDNIAIDGCPFTKTTVCGLKKKTILRFKTIAIDSFCMHYCK